MINEIGDNHPLRKMFRGMVEQVFHSDLGICDVELTDYLAELLAEFVHVDAIYRMHRIDGQVIRDVARVEAEACLGPSVEGTARTRLINRYIGDFTLFWAGLYPESLRMRGRADRLREYLLQGKRSYGIAGELSDALPPGGTLLRHLSDEFEYCVHGLHRLRQEWRGFRRN